MVEKTSVKDIKIAPNIIPSKIETVVSWI